MTQANKPDIKYLFEPRSVAIIGASHSKGKIGYKMVENIVYGGYKGKIYPINPKGGEMLGLRAYTGLDEVEGDIDMACIVVPAKYTFDAVRECARKNVKYLVVITSGFSEIGNRDEENQIVEFAKENGMRVLGPNIFGIYSAGGKINATFGPKDIMEGGVSIITQSGALGIAMIGKTKAENIGLSSIISLGNKADVDEADLLEYLVNEERTKVIMMYIEGIKEGERLICKLKEITRKKPVVVIKSGRSKRGAMAAASHTGSLAGADEVFSSIMTQCGVLRAESIEEALNWCKFFTEIPAPKGENCVIITNGGGIGVMCADACEKYGVELYDDIKTMKDAFADAVPPFGSLKNPVDLTGGAAIEDYERCIRAALNHKNIDSIICLGCEAAVFDVDKLPDMTESIFKDKRNLKPIVFSFVGGSRLEEKIGEMRRRGIPVFPELYSGVSCLGAAYRQFRYSKAQVEPDAVVDIDADTINEVIRGARADDRTFLLAHESSRVMEAAGIIMPQSRVARNLDEAVKYAESIGYPVVMKVVSKDIIHKSDAGGVALDLDNKEEIIDAYQAIMRNCKAYKADALIEGVEIAEMVNIKAGVETIIGARIDGSFGPTVMFGLGGIYVEVMKDVTFRSFPLTHREAVKMVSEIKSYALLLGVRGEKKKDINEVVNTILKVGAILQKCSDISDIEVNPLIVYEEGKGAKALDARILLTKSKVVE
ncbi:MAG: CoA-binding protein [Thermoplasmata archaeon HGW-Thermoplasmata-1]|nr:MAG: CoA-binding protein [Thermoplasmata archaeon HGW-Thermoplasmata-1]